MRLPRRFVTLCNENETLTFLFPMPTKRKFYPLATFLHALTLVVCFVLVCFLSWRIATRTLISQVPTQVTGWILVDGSRQEFSLDAAAAQKAAQWIDNGEYSPDEAYEVEGEFTFTFVSGKKVTFALTSRGPRCMQGFYRLVPMDPTPFRELFLASVNPKQPTEIENR
ncbi:MAG: hypothetical protein Q4D62_12845 [Planctomycetia bacterium]|nr:hypothetical protein [Planctomycetia bacterium]